jgi:hypothetical protein
MNKIWLIDQSNGLIINVLLNYLEAADAILTDPHMKQF